MVDLLPEKYKKNIKYEHLLRFASGALFLFFLSITLFVLFSLSSHVLLMNKEDSLNRERESLLGFIEEFKKEGVEEYISLLETKLNLLQEQRITFSINEIILEILEQRPKGVHINGMSYKKKEEVTLNIFGVADIRRDLLNFVDLLEKVRFIRKVDLPISNLTKDEEVFFSINLKIFETEEEK